MEVNDLHASIEAKKILNGVNLKIREGEVHAIMGRNGSGKSTLSKVIAGHPLYTINSGEISFQGKAINNLEPEERAAMGIFLGFQYPVEVPGVSNSEFLRAATNARRKYLKKEELDTFEFDEFVTTCLEVIQMNSSFLERNLNEGFSGGEKKRNEILQMAILEPIVSILDETDSGLDIDSLRIVSQAINKLSTKKTSTILITHYKRLLDEIKPDFVHIMNEGKIIKTGTIDLAIELEKGGFKRIQDSQQDKK
ncbi:MULTISPECIES: Fe-S cluster assembly ATPase SufC [Prochlorococcus]|uniref:Fe-S cluster assembly ATPase SufC n=1 Tax=Prochlorococcus sp. MIT 0601 TaxID=1499498 RepID=UPI000AF5EE23